MSDTRERRRARTSGPGHDYLRGGLRSLSEVIAWVGTAWIVGSHSIPLAIAAVALLIVPSAIFSTPGDRPGGDAPVAVPGVVTIVLLLIQLLSATLAAWALWPTWIATPVTALCLLVLITEQPRWRSLTSRLRHQRGGSSYCLASGPGWPGCGLTRKDGVACTASMAEAGPAQDDINGSCSALHHAGPAAARSGVGKAGWKAKVVISTSL